MNAALRHFIAAHYEEHPAAIVALKEFAVAFRDSLPRKAQAAWTRQRVLTELTRGGFAVGVVDKVAHVAGIAPKGAQWIERDGRLEPQTNG